MTLGVITTGDATVNRRQRILLGIATAWPFAYGILFAVFAMPYLDAANAGSEAAKDYLIQKFIPAMLLPHTLALACLGSLVLITSTTSLKCRCERFRRLSGFFSCFSATCW